MSTELYCPKRSCKWGRPCADDTKGSYCTNPEVVLSLIWNTEAGLMDCHQYEELDLPEYSSQYQTY